MQRSPPGKQTKRQNPLVFLEHLFYYAGMKRKRGAQPGNKNARKHGFYSPTISPEEISLVWNAVNLKGSDPAVAVIRVKLHSALQCGPANPHRLLEDTAKLLTKRPSKELRMDEFDRRQFRAVILSALELSHSPSPASLGSAPRAPLPKQNEADRTQVTPRDKLSLPAHKPRRRTNRACQARMAKQDQSSVL